MGLLPKGSFKSCVSEIAARDPQQLSLRFQFRETVLFGVDQTQLREMRSQEGIDDTPPTLVAGTVRLIDAFDNVIYKIVNKGLTPLALAELMASVSVISESIDSSLDEVIAAFNLAQIKTTGNA
jgi:hypothetical protein